MAIGLFIRAYDRRLNDFDTISQAWLRSILWSTQVGLGVVRHYHGAHRHARYIIESDTFKVLEYAGPG